MPCLRMSVVVAAVVAAATSPVLAQGNDRVAKVTDMTDAVQALTSDQSGGVDIVAEGPGGESVARFDDHFQVRYDLGAKRINPRDYDLLKLQVKADAHAMLVVSLENFPEPGQLSHWYVLDTARTQVPWRTIWIDLNKPEEIKEAGSYKGMAAEDPDARGLLVRGGVTDIRRSIQGPGRSIWLGDVRFVQKAFDLDWDQSQAPYTWRDGDLVFTYPLTLVNRVDEPLTVRFELAPVDVEHARAQVSENPVTLAPGQTRQVEAKLTLPAAVAGEAQPLYAERFEVIARAEGFDDSEVTILRSSDPIPLSVTVPLPESQLQFPLLPRVSTIPDKVTGWDRAKAEAVKLAEAVSPQDLETALDGPFRASWEDRRGFNYWGKGDQAWHKAGSRYRQGLTACAFLYDHTGDRKYLEKGTQLLLKAAELFPQHHAAWRNTPYTAISHGIFCGNVLGMGWSTGAMRGPYDYDRHGMFNDFDLLAADMDPSARETILRDFIVPAAIQMRNHYFGLSNQQDVINHPIMYAGLATRNWPLVSHAYDSSHGLLNQIRYAFDDEGMASEANYHKPSIEPILYACELLHAQGLDLYNQRLYDILHSRAAAAINKGYSSPILGYVEEHRFAGKDITHPPKTDGVHLSTGVTVLKWDGREVAMNWGVQQNRSAPDRNSLRIGKLGGGNYTHSSLGQSIIIVDEERQNPVPAQVLGVDVVGPVQYVSSASAEHYPGSRITRTFALLGQDVLVMDRVTSDQPRTIDWCLLHAGEKLSLPVERVAGGFTDKPNDRAHGVIYGADLKNDEHFVASTSDAWTEGGGRLMMAGQPGTRVFYFRVPPAFSASKKDRERGLPLLMVRRPDVAQTDFVAFFSKQTRSVEQAPVVTAAGRPADAIGARITLDDGRVIHAIVNFQVGEEVRLGSLTTRERFATDFPDQ